MQKSRVQIQHICIKEGLFLILKFVDKVKFLFVHIIAKFLLDTKQIFFSHAPTIERVEQLPNFPLYQFEHFFCSMRFILVFCGLLLINYISISKYRLCFDFQFRSFLSIFFTILIPTPLSLPVTSIHTDSLPLRLSFPQTSLHPIYNHTTA